MSGSPRFAQTVPALAAVAAIAVTALFLLSGLAASVAPIGARTSVSAVEGVTVRTAPTAGAAGTSAAPRPMSSPSATPSPSAAPSCPTPQNAPDWTSANFFDDALVDFQVPGYSNLSGSNFQTVPCQNTLPMYVQSFWLNVSTNVALSQAYVTIWGTTYPTPTNPLPALGGYDPATPTLQPMYIPATAPNTASFYFNVYKSFYPGTTVYFNITLESSEAIPSTISSTESPYHSPIPQGYNDNATWSFYVAAPWWSTTFTNDIEILTNPSVLGAVPYPPNPAQQFSVDLQSVSASGAPGPAIPEARFNFQLSGQFTGTFSLPFGPLNASRVNLSSYAGTNGIGPYPGTHVLFSITAWLPWEGGAIDTITSPTYSFNWSSQGGWTNPTEGLAANAELNASPNVLGAGSHILPTGTPVNLTVHVPVPNETISSAVVQFTYTDADGSLSGNLPMTLATANTSFARLPGLPSDGTMTFSLSAKDVHGDPVSSGTYVYRETGSPTGPQLPGSAWIYVQGANLSSGLLLPAAAYSLSNGTWSFHGATNPLGFGSPLAASQAGYRQLGDGVYTVTMTAYGRTLSTQVTLTGTAPIVVTFAFAPPGSSLGGTATVPVTTIVAALVAGPLIATAALLPLFRWYRVRQAKAMAEQQRITL